MRVNRYDMSQAGVFAVSLQKACEEMLAGAPMTKALSGHGISKNTFLTLIKGLRKPGSHDMPDSEHLDALKHPSWQDELAYDICGDDSVYVPDDFEEELYDIEEKYLEPDEAEIIELCYKNGMTVKKAAKLMDLAESNAAKKKNLALEKLRDHKDELYFGKKFMDSYHELKTVYDSNAAQIRWMDEAIDYLNDAAYQSEKDIDELTLEAKDFFIENGFRKISDIYGLTPEEVVKRITDFATEQAVVKTAEFSPDDRLSDMDFSEETLRVFDDEGLVTVEDAFALSDDEAASLPKAGRIGLMKLYRMAAGSRE